MVDLVHIQPCHLQGAHQLAQVVAAPRQAFVVVTRLVQRIGAVKRRERTIRLAVQQHKFGLDAREHSQAHGIEFLHLGAQGDPRAIFVRLAQHMAVTGNTRVAGHPGQQRQRGQVTHGRVLGAMRTHAQTPDGETGKPRTRGQQSLEMPDRHALGFGRAVDIHKLRQYKLDVVLLEKFPCVCDVHECLMRCGIGPTSVG